MPWIAQLPIGEGEPPVFSSIQGNEKPEWLSEVQRLQLKTGDVLIVKLVTPTLAQVDAMRAIFENLFPGNRVEVVDSEVDFGVISTSLLDRDW